jgi:hypothetical protein
MPKKLEKILMNTTQKMKLVQEILAAEPIIQEQRLAILQVLLIRENQVKKLLVKQR